MDDLVIQCGGRTTNTAGQPTGDRCNKTFPRPSQPALTWPHTPVDDAAYLTAARANGWRVHRPTGGDWDAMCPTCAAPDPDVVRICRDLRRPKPARRTTP